MNFYAKNGNIILKQPDFDLAQTLDCGQSFRWQNCGDSWQGYFLNRYLKISQNGDIFTFFDTNEADFLDIWADYFDLFTDYGALKLRFSNECPVLKTACQTCGGIRILKQDFWEMLVSFIFSQQNNIPRIKKIINSLCDVFGGFPDAQSICDAGIDALEPLKSGFRAKYIIDAAQAVASGEINADTLKNADYETAKKILMQIKGVGPKVANCVLLFGLYKVEAFPVDVWIRRILDEHYPNGFPQTLSDVGGIAQQYLFHYFRSVPAQPCSVRPRARGGAFRVAVE